MKKTTLFGSVSFLNGRPLLFDWENNNPGNIKVVYQNPARLSKSLLEGKIDVGLVPVVEVFRYHYQVCPRVSINSFGPCMSVRCFYKTKISSIRRVWVTRESHSSVALLKILFVNFYNMNPEIIPVLASEKKIPTNDTALLLIGDKCMNYSADSKYFDLSEIWYEWTGLPFVFAVWASPGEISNNIQDFLIQSKFRGLNAIDEIINRYRGEIPRAVLYEYFHHQIKYHLGVKEKKGMRLFRSYWMRLKEMEVKNDTRRSRSLL